MMEIFTLSASQIPEAAQVLAQSFWSDPAMQALFELFDEPERRRRFGLFFAATLAACTRRGWALAVRCEDRIAAVGTIYPPGTYPLPMWEQARLLAGGMLRGGWLEPNTWRLTRDMRRSFREVEREHPTRPHYYLEWVGVTPERQGHGLGTALFETVLRRADSEGVGCYLETENARTLALYERLGFEVYKNKEVMGVTTWFLWREPAQLP